MRLLLDTHIFLWHINGEAALSAAAREAIVDPSNDVYLSIASAWEIAIKYSLGKLPMPSEPADYVPKQRRKHRISKLPIRESDFKTLIDLPPIHGDPFDRMLVAQAIGNDFVLVTDDEMVKRYPVTVFG